MSFINTLYRAQWKLKKLHSLMRGWMVPFKRTGRGKVLLGPMCEFKNPQWVSFGGNNIIERCAVFYADSPNSISIGHHTSISKYSAIQTAGGHINIGDRTQIGDFCILYGQGGLEIGNDVMFGSGIQVIPNQHTYTDLSKPMKDCACVSKGIFIEDDVWIGAHVVILDGVRIGQGSVIAAGAVVTNDVEPYSVVAGIPAKVIKKRK